MESQCAVLVSCCTHFAKVAELVDAQDSGSCAHCGCEGSSPSFRIKARSSTGLFFCFQVLLAHSCMALIFGLVYVRRSF